MRTGKVSAIPKDVSFHEAIENYYPETRIDYIHSTYPFPLLIQLNHDSQDLQRLQVLANEFIQAIIASTNKLPYGMRCIARETLAALHVSYLITLNEDCITEVAKAKISSRATR
jgi:Ras GTPase-activating-like protein IQGAP2/3